MPISYCYFGNMAMYFLLHAFCLLLVEPFPCCNKNARGSCFPVYVPFLWSTFFFSVGSLTNTAAVPFSRVRKVCSLELHHPKHGLGRGTVGSVAQHLLVFLRSPQKYTQVSDMNFQELGLTWTSEFLWEQGLYLAANTSRAFACVTEDSILTLSQEKGTYFNK